MKLKSEMGLQILEKYKGKTESDRWIDHCICVGDTAGIIAKALNVRGYNVDVDKTIAIGYVHDIGKYRGQSHGHVMRGYEFLKEEGLDEDYCNIYSIMRIGKKFVYSTTRSIILLDIQDYK